MCFLKIIASCIVPLNRMDAGLVWKELVILFFMRVVKLLVMCCTAMSLPPGVYVRMGFNCIDSWSFYCYLITDKGLIVLISDHDDLLFYTIFGPLKIILVHMRRVNQ